MHIFKYSPRKGTKAAVMEGQIDGSIKEQRSKRLIELSDNNELKYNKQYIGKEVSVLFEEKDKEGYYKGHTNNFIVVKAQSNKYLENMIKKVKISEAKREFIMGNILM